MANERDASVLSEILDRLRLSRRGGVLGLFEWEAESGVFRVSPEWGDGTPAQPVQMARSAHPAKLGDLFAAWEELAHPDDRDGLAEFRRALAAAPGRPREVRHRVRRMDGTYRGVLTRAVRRAGNSRRSPSIVGYHLDVSDSRPGKRPSEDPSGLARTILDSLSSSVVVLDREGAIIACTEPWAEFARENAPVDASAVGVGDNYLDACLTALADGAEGAAGHIRGIVGVLTGAVRSYEAEYPGRSPGAPRWFVMRVAPCLAGRGMVVIAHDEITDRRQADEAIRASEARYRRLHENIRDGVVSVDMEGRFLEFNEVFRGMLGYDREELLGLTYRDVTPEPWHAMEDDIVRNVILPRGYSDVYAKEYRRKDGTVVPVELRVSLIRDEAGKPAEMWAVVRDVTERRRAEAALHALAAHLVSVREEERTRIARRIHDDLGQVLTRIKMDAAWLRRHVDGAPEAVLERLEGMTQEADGAIEAVQRIGLDLRPAALDELGLCAAIEAEVRRFQTRTGIDCVFSSHPAEPQVGADRATELFRILQECLSNVARHSGASAARVELREEGGSIAVTIQDNGRGIRPEEWSSPASLGLHGIRERVAVLGGTFVIRGEQGKGTRAEVRIPRGAS